MAEVWNKVTEKNKSEIIPATFNVVIHRGKTEWDIPKSLKEHFLQNNVEPEFIHINCPYIPVDLSKVDIEKLDIPRKHKDKFLLLRN